MKRNARSVAGLIALVVALAWALLGPAPALAETVLEYEP